MQTVIVAGGAGFIGSHLCEKLLIEGYHVICIDNLLTSNKKNIENFLQNANFTFVEQEDRKSTRLNSSHQIISYAVFCLKKKNICIGPTYTMDPHLQHWSCYVDNLIVK